MNSWMFSSKDSKMEASMLAICGAMTCTLQFNSRAVAEVPQPCPSRTKCKSTASKGGVHESKEFKGANVFSHFGFGLQLKFMGTAFSKMVTWLVSVSKPAPGTLVESGR